MNCKVPSDSNTARIKSAEIALCRNSLLWLAPTNAKAPKMLRLGTNNADNTGTQMIIPISSRHISNAIVALRIMPRRPINIKRQRITALTEANVLSWGPRLKVGVIHVGQKYGIEMRGRNQAGNMLKAGLNPKQRERIKVAKYNSTAK